MGRTRPFNVVDLQNCRTAQLVYTCLSRSSSADGTLIIQGFDPQHITGGHSGYLRQEFRELELLDEITRLCSLDKLPYNQLQTRRPLIHWFRTLKGENFVPKATHSAIHWSKDDPMEFEEPDDDIDFEVLKKSDEARKKEKAQKHMKLNQLAKYVPAKGSKALTIAS